MRQDVTIKSDQEKAIAALERAIKACEKAEVYLWDDYGCIGALDGRVVVSVCPDDSYDEELPESEIYTIHSPAWHPAVADDQNLVKYR